MKLVYSSNQPFNYFNGLKVIKWNGRNSDNNKLPTGVYIYTAKTGDNLAKGKLVIFNQ
jgi:flagellar hook assembly protein FlgD